MSDLLDDLDAIGNDRPAAPVPVAASRAHKRAREGTDEDSEGVAVRPPRASPPLQATVDGGTAARSSALGTESPSGLADRVRRTHESRTERNGEDAEEEEEESDDDHDDDDDDDDDEAMASGGGAADERFGVRLTDVEQSAKASVSLMTRGLGSSSSSSSSSGDAGRLHDVARLRRNHVFQEHMARVAAALLKSEPDAIIGNLEDHPEYRLIVVSNALMVQVREEMELVRRLLANLYAVRFPDLASIIPDPVMFARAVRLIGNEPVTSALSLEEVLPSSLAMVVLLQGSTLDTRELTAAEWTDIAAACDEIVSLETSRVQMLRLVESRMRLVAPNVSAMLGTALAARLVALAGGLSSLSRTPACNIQVLGQDRGPLLGGLSRATVKAHRGVIYEAEIVRTAPANLQARVGRVLAAKLALVARVDAARSRAFDSTLGSSMLELIRSKIAKWSEPPPLARIKPLPKPDDKLKKRRGGKRMRRLKEKYAETEVRREMDRVNMTGSAADYSEVAMGRDLGRLMAGGSGRVRVTKKDQRNLLKRTGKAMLRGATEPGAGSAPGGGATSGLASTLAMRGTQGMELVNPELAKARAPKANRYFDQSAGFVHARPTPTPQG